MYYFAFRNGDPAPIYSGDTLEELRSRYIGEYIRVGDEPHDTEQVIDIWTEEQMREFMEG
jgi:hypothetical protein